ncbi:MAG: TetR family transcriptional regulator C-terminal domain-containing protein [Pseudomonadota bacterium]
MTPARSKSKPKGRTASKAFRRQQLIDATIDSIARRGLAGTTLADVADGAGLSRGIVNFHFQSKTALLEDTLRYLAEEYRGTWRAALDKAGPAPIDRLCALVEVDLDPKVCNRKKVAVWYAFWGEAKSRPTYLALCGAYDREYFEALEAICWEVVREGPYPERDGRLIALSLSSMTDGMWQSLLLNPGDFDRKTAKRACLAFLATTFPQHLRSDRSSAA